jgi:hypothetical protein
MVGDANASGPLQSSQPDQLDGWLAYLRAYTSELNVSPDVGRLEQLQLVWATSTCHEARDPDAARTAQAGAPVGTRANTAVVTEVTVEAPPVAVMVEEVNVQQAPAAVPMAMPAVTAPSQGGTFAPPSADLISASSMAQNSTNDNADANGGNTAPVCEATGLLCSDGACATSSCALGGMGKDVATMMCFGTNMLPNPLLAVTTGNPCAHLACKLDRPNCTSSGIGWAGFCTGRVTATSSSAKLHPSGKVFLGHPCIEHKGPMLNLMPLADYSARGIYAAKAWKVCDCIRGPGLKADSIAVSLPRLQGGLPFSTKPLREMLLPDVLAQWVAGVQAGVSVPLVSIGKAQADALRSLMPNITLPSLVVPKISRPLLRLPTNFSLPLFVLPFGGGDGDDADARGFEKLMAVLPNITSLPTLLMPDWDQLKALPMPHLQLPEVRTSNPIEERARLAC